MWQRTALISVILHLALPLQAEDAFRAEALPSIPAELLSQDSRLRFRIVSGKVVVHTIHYGTKRRETAKRNDGTHVETLTYLLGDPAVSLRYEIDSIQGRLLIEVPHGDALSAYWRMVEPSGETEVVYRQLPDRVLFSVNGPAGEKRFVQRSLWHLLICQPELSRRYLLPMLTLCRNKWNLGEQLDQVQQELCRCADTIRLPSRGQLMTWVRQLSSTNRKDRHVAMKHLREVGQPLLAFLDGLNQDHLDREQRHQVSQLRHVLEYPAVDTPSRVATRLVADVNVWTSLSFHRDVQTRILAAHQLKRLTGHTTAIEDYAASK